MIAEESNFKAYTGNAKKLPSLQLGENKSSFAVNHRPSAGQSPSETIKESEREGHRWTGEW